MAMKEMDCFNYFPGDVKEINKEGLELMLKRDGRKGREFVYNGIWLGGEMDNQRQTTFHYIYASGNLLGGK